MKITRKTIFGSILTLPFVGCVLIVLYNLVLEALAGHTAAIFLIGISSLVTAIFLFAKGMAMIMEERDE